MRPDRLRFGDDRVHRLVPLAVRTLREHLAFVSRRGAKGPERSGQRREKEGLP